MFDEDRRPPVTRQRWAEFALSRDERLRDELVNAHLGLVRRLAHRFTNAGIPTTTWSKSDRWPC